MLQCTRRLHSLTQSVAVQGERNWATALSGLRRADYRPLQLRLRNRISPRRPPVEGTQPCVTDADNAVVQFIECKPLRNYDRSNSECQKTEFEFINRTSNFRTSFNNPKRDDVIALSKEVLLWFFGLSVCCGIIQNVVDAFL